MISLLRLQLCELQSIPPVMEISRLSLPAEIGFRAGQQFVTVSLKARDSLDISYVDSHKLFGVNQSFRLLRDCLLLPFWRLRYLA